MIEPMTDAELAALPAAVDLTSAGRALGIGRTKSYELARAGQFPCRVIPVGPKFRVPRTELLRMLGIDPAEAAAQSSGTGRARRRPSGPASRRTTPRRAADWPGDADDGPEAA